MNLQIEVVINSATFVLNRRLLCKLSNHKPCLVVDTAYYDFLGDKEKRTQFFGKTFCKRPPQYVPMCLSIFFTRTLVCF